MTDIITTRGTSIPTRKGTLPYSSTYSISNYMYSSRYFKEYVDGDYASVAFVVSPDTANQKIKVSWIDGRNDESMGSKTKTLTSTKANQLIGMDWVYGGEKFYFKITNNSSSKISG